MGDLVAVGQNRHTHEHGALSVVWVDIRKVGEVNGGTVLDGLQAAGGVEVTDSLRSLGLLRNRTLRLLDSSAEGSGASDLISSKARDELELY